ncbi:RdRP-domain-containing protein [Dendrothele bispora CBS 962.96]|uniref:RNA-dependent RNA polymerase n=1 Tax=Dendrothele bispora (strain CBS 962.96) TaxID=1314807 RepID=A0A4S8LYQ0_DENBC|nr:RdRP-domain-containing protein [Dendrothele bispora CBS 962.96]
MEIFVRNIPYSTSLHTVTRELADLFHSKEFISQYASSLNFDLRPPSRRRPGQGRVHNGNALLTLPTQAIAEYFLSEYGETPHRKPAKTLKIGGREIRFSKSRQPEGRPDIIQRILNTPYIDPAAAEERDRREEVLNSKTVSVQTVQFGWDGRDGFYSVEWEYSPPRGGQFSFDPERREFQIEMMDPYQPNCCLVIAFRPSQVRELSVSSSPTRESALYFSLWSHPIFFRKFVRKFEDNPDPHDPFSIISQFLDAITPPKPSERLVCLPMADHGRVAPFTSRALRFTCRSPNDLKEFRSICDAAQFHSVQNWDYPAKLGDSFSKAVQRNLESSLESLHWSVTFQVEALIRNGYLDMKEALQILPDIKNLVEKHGREYTVSFLQYFGLQVYTWYPGEGETLNDFFNLIQSDKPPDTNPTVPLDTSLFQSLHLLITPTTMYPEGPFIERSNRVIRAYPGNHDSFLRVSFGEEDGTRYRFDRDIDGPTFIRNRVRPFLVDGLVIAGHRFEFLGYSQSALREHAVWFIKPFRHNNGQEIDAASIIASLGDFRRDDLIRCPARYGARISLAFTATDPTLVRVEDIRSIDDISTTDHKYDFTDGVGSLSTVFAGTISRELTRGIISERKTKKKKRSRRNEIELPAIQIRFMGSKGMLSVDHNLQGFTICLRPSMTKFSAPESRNIEIAEIFDRPRKFYLNRPLIMVLEGLGVPYEVFEKYQDLAVSKVYESTRSLDGAAKMLETFGLGTSFRLTSVMLNLSKRLGFDHLRQDSFYQQVLKYAVHHVLRDLKHHTRIPIERAWTLVGVADIHQFLEEGEIFACVKPNDSEAIFLEGPILISRSPVIHPGDVQIVHAIGKPPEGSCFATEPLQNTVVFATKGSRPLPSMLSGGDLDGDQYCLLPLDIMPEFKPSKIYPSASYEPAPRKTLDHPATTRDIAEFVIEYINSDLVGMIATTWLILADKSPKGIFDPGCLTLSQLQSDAVDYPKTGQPVDPEKIPRLRFRERPDYQAPETVRPDNTDYYESLRAIGRLFRKIDLPELSTQVYVPKRQRRMIRKKRGGQGLSEGVDELSESISNVQFEDDDLAVAIHEYVKQYIDSETDLVMRTKIENERVVISRIFTRYCSELETRLAANTLGQSRTSTLSEEEAMVGTIAQKTSQPRKRSEHIARLREQTDHLVRELREELMRGEDLVQNLIRAKLGWDLSARERRKGSVIGAQSFFWITLGVIFDLTKEIEEQGEWDEEWDS